MKRRRETTATRGNCIALLLLKICLDREADLEETSAAITSDNEIRRGQGLQIFRNQDLEVCRAGLTCHLGKERGKGAG